LYSQKKSLKDQLKFKEDIIKTMKTQIRLQKKAIKEFKKGRTPSEAEIRQKEEELKIKRQRERRLQVQTGLKIFKELRNNRMKLK